jgi:uncharacterized protein
MAAELIPMPAAPKDLLRVNRFFPFEEGGRRFLFVVETAAFCEADEASWRMAEAIAGLDRVKKSELSSFGEETIHGFEQLEILEPFERSRQQLDLQPIEAEPLTTLVLHVSHDCNMRCGYCYADYGRYGGDFGTMDPELAIAHAEKFFDQLGASRKVQVTFFGGEPLMNMPVVYAAHAYTKERAEKEGRKISYGLTTNGTLLTRELAEFFERERFSITVSIDGPPDVNDRLRPLQDGKPSYERIIEGVKASGLKPHARVTLTRKCLDVARIVRHLVEAGFVEVGVSPVATGDARFDLDAKDLQVLLRGLRALCDDFVEYAKQGKLFPFSNVRTVLEQIAAGDVRPVPCGAATKLVAADNKGDLYACHRLVGQEQFKVGHVSTGVDAERRFDLLHAIHPRTREPCQTCWARYLCGGGCHHIAWLHSDMKASPWMIGDFFCDFLREWYRLGLYTYARMSEEAPEVLARLAGPGRSRSACNQPQGQ